MKALLQRVSSASVEIDKELFSSIGLGMLIFLGIEKNDTQNIADKMIDKILKFRMFADSNDKLNLNIKDIGGEILLVSQFTLAADTNSGTRAGFSTAKNPQDAKVLYDYFLQNLKHKHQKTQNGIFGADMQISLINNGPISFLLEVANA